MLSYSQLQSGQWERSQLLEALAVREKSLISALFIGNAICESFYISFERLAITLIGNVQSCSLDGMFLHTEQKGNQ